MAVHGNRLGFDLKSLLRIFAITIAAFALPAEAATRLIIDTVDQGSPGKAQIVISEDRVRITHSSMPRQEMLFYATDRLVLFIHHARKEITRINPDVLQQSVDQLAGLADQLQEQRNKLPEEKREQFDAMLQGLGIARPDEIGGAKISVAALGKTETIGGIRCDWWQVNRDGDMIGQSCLTKNNELKIETADFDVLLQLADYVQELQLTAGALMSSFGFTLPPLGLVDKTTVPIKLTKSGGAYSAALSMVDRLDVSLRLSVPSGYRTIEMAAN